MTVSVSPAAQRDLGEIWKWNANRYGEAHADEYVAFLRNRTEQLAVIDRGRLVPTRLHMRYVTIRRRRKGHGHLAVYETVDDRIVILRYFHTAQDWPSQLD